MIRINLLAEAQAAEELRRRDPVKRATWGAAGLVGLVFIWACWTQFAVMKSSSALDRAQTTWNSLEKQDNLTKTNIFKAGQIERKLAALERLRTNRVLWSAPLDALQFCIIENIQLTDLDVKQSCVLTPAKVNPNTKQEEKPAVSTETIALTLKGRDFAPDTEGNHIKFMDAIKSNPYFRGVLRKPDAMTEIERVRAAAEAGETRRGASFGFKCQFASKVREMK